MANCTSNNDCKSRLNLLTYLTPGLPLELFQTYQHLFEEVLNCESFLSIESRWHSPPEGKADPFTSNAMDIDGHIESIKAVAENHADAAAIDSNVLRIWLAENPEYQDKLRVLCSWGPYPVQPIVVNKRLPTSIKEKMTKALLNIDQYPAIAKRFVHYGIQGFVEIDDSHYNTTREIMKISAGEHLYPAYY